MGSTTYGTMNDPKGGVAKVTCRTFEAMGQIPMFHRTYFLFIYFLQVTYRSDPSMDLDVSCTKDGVLQKDVLFGVIKNYCLPPYFPKHRILTKSGRRKFSPRKRFTMWMPTRNHQHSSIKVVVYRQNWSAIPNTWLLQSADPLLIDHAYVWFRHRYMR